MTDANTAVPSVEHPPHYNAGSIEVIDVIEDWKLGFHLGNAVKYIGRAEHKGNGVIDLRKAVWYLNREIARREILSAVTVEPEIRAAYSISKKWALDQEGSDELRQRVVAFLQSRPGERFAVRALAKEVGIPGRPGSRRYHCFTTVLSRLYRGGRIQRSSRGVYQAVAG